VSIGNTNKYGFAVFDPRALRKLQAHHRQKAVMHRVRSEKKQEHNETLKIEISDKKRAKKAHTSLVQINDIL